MFSFRKMSKIQALLLSFFIVFSLVGSISLFNGLEERENVIVARVIDGDTVELDDGRTIRLANINAPEKDSPLSKYSKSYLEEYTNKSIGMSIVEIDNYGRYVANLYNPNYMNLELVSSGFSSKAWVSESMKNEFKKAEQEAINKGLGIWQHSQYWGCFSININAEEEKIFLESLCNVSLNNFYIKDESRKIYKFLNSLYGDIEIRTGDGEDEKNILYWKSTNVWNNDRDSAYLFDNEDKIAGYYSYGY